MSEKIRVDLNRGKCAKVKAAGAPQHWRRPQMDPFHNCRTPDPAVRESGLNDVPAPSATAGRGYANP